MDEKVMILREIIKTRRSIFPASYTKEPVPVSYIKEILESANYAPTHKLTEPWRFTVFTGGGKSALGEEMARLYEENTDPAKFLQKKYDSILTKAAQAGCIIAINAELHPDKLPEWEEVAAVGCAVQNMALTANALGLGAYWSSPGMITHLVPFLKSAENERCFGLFYIGFHDAPARNAVRTPIEDKVKWVDQ
ncbi:MAG: nitroreductase [Pedobacter sp.]|nr:MAG: nitroreductase [Pedobacter sp.]